MLFSGLFAILAFSSYNFWPASIISLTILLIKVLESTWKQSAFYAFFWGIGFFGSGLQWMYISLHRFSNISNYIVIILIIFFLLYLALFPIFFSIVLSVIRSYLKIMPLRYTVSIIPVLWSIIEYVREYMFTGFPWLQLGYSQIDGPLKSIAPIFGVEGVTFVLVLISGLLSVSIIQRSLLPAMIAAGILLCLWCLTCLHWYSVQPKRAVHVSLVQGNIDQKIKWDVNYVEHILRTYVRHTLTLLGTTKIIIWPESAIPGNEKDYSYMLTILDKKLSAFQTNLITGIIGINNIKNIYCYYNSIIVLGNFQPYKYPSINRYDKHHLVLFTETYPCQKSFIKLLFNILDMPVFFMQKGSYIQNPLITSQVKITAVICYEIICGKQMRNNFSPDTDFLLTVANNAWFGDSTEPWQYLQIARMRALELGRPLLCSTNNGVTAIINADGSVQVRLLQFISSVLNATVAPTTGLTPYAKFGSKLFWSVSLFFICVFLCLNFKIIYKRNSNFFLD
ncbi:apolipoprotein N-acyltransferase [Candidatus Blochmannia ocreatus (nom. nud.)]|uniref:Apolipoprotein N-acyltransferase n=1 Tax=Candidatus Blochmannia ocreatus (nom. nud.) TaxID=251538 RepID=A0ABY4SVC7_9ENTR|nr:apolipoprotein N-acyltransferase [Candidatus Blochmannia ocreatus]URJ25374.1 apolipoprotein N-acyltransferase [Candidatus Blochmannia ocreatus]